MRLYWLIAFLLIPLVGIAAPQQFREGAHYQLVTPEQPRKPNSKVEVVEFLWYGCETCFVIQSDLGRWKNTRKDTVDYQRMPAITNEGMIFMARVFYTAEVLGIAEKIHQPLFEAIHKHRRQLNTEQTLAAFFEEQGVGQKDFHQAFRSSYVAGKVRKARTTGSRYGIAGAPTIIVNGKYRVDSSMVTSPEELIAVMDFLVNKEAANKI
jgi:thiol:disulfide interchange protein DsbA